MVTPASHSRRQGGGLVVRGVKLDIGAACALGCNTGGAGTGERVQYKVAGSRKALDQRSKDVKVPAEVIVVDHMERTPTAN